jgi:phosphopantothenoylcysteine synthetase/decarboxylase
MHSSLAEAPTVSRNISSLEHLGAKFLASRDEEGKRKFPDPSWLADQVAHELRRSARLELQPSKAIPRVLVSMGTTRGYIDDVRYISNYSSGALGSLVVEELHRHGILTDVVSGPCPVKPRSYWRLTDVETNAEMTVACRSALSDGAEAAILAASVLDFAPDKKMSGKIKSADHAQLNISMVRQPKIIREIHPSSGIKVGFKLEAHVSDDKALELAQSYMTQYGLSLMVINALDDVDQSRHRAWFFEQRQGQKGVTPLGVVDTKTAVAKHIAVHILSQFP